MIAALGWTWGCDIPPATALSPPPITTLRWYPSDVLPRDGTVLVEIDAALDPYSLLGSDVAVRSGDRQLGASLRYDPVWRTLYIDPVPELLDPDVDYVFFVDGPTSFDGRRLGPSTFRLRVTEALATPGPDPVRFEEVRRALSGCEPCHGPERAVLGLDVTDLRGTAVGVPAEEVRSAAFGPALVGTQRIEPHHPERSYLLYKMLGEGPIVGDVMGAADTPGVSLSRTDVGVISRWIAEGAHVDDRVEP